MSMPIVKLADTIRLLRLEVNQLKGQYAASPMGNQTFAQAASGETLYNTTLNTTSMENVQFKDDQLITSTGNALGFPTTAAGTLVDLATEQQLETKTLVQPIIGIIKPTAGTAITLPEVTDTFVTLNATQILTAKTLTTPTFNTSFTFARGTNPITITKTNNSKELTFDSTILKTVEWQGTAVAAAYVGNLPAGKITSDAFHVDRIPSLNASKINAGAFASARLSGSYTGITGLGTVTVGNINAALLTSGTLPTARLSGVYNSITGLSGLTALALAGTFTMTGGTDPFTITKVDNEDKVIFSGGFQATTGEVGINSLVVGHDADNPYTFSLTEESPGLWFLGLSTNLAVSDVWFIMQNAGASGTFNVSIPDRLNVSAGQLFVDSTGVSLKNGAHINTFDNTPLTGSVTKVPTNTAVKVYVDRPRNHKPGDSSVKLNV